LCHRLSALASLGAGKIIAGAAAGRALAPKGCGD